MQLSGGYRELIAKSRAAKAAALFVPRRANADEGVADSIVHTRNECFRFDERTAGK